MENNLGTWPNLNCVNTSYKNHPNPLLFSISQKAWADSHPSKAKAASPQSPFQLQTLLPFQNHRKFTFVPVLQFCVFSSISKGKGLVDHCRPSHPGRNGWVLKGALTSLLSSSTKQCFGCLDFAISHQHCLNQRDLV